MINTLTLKFGRHGSKENLVINLDSVTIFVGPNNSGKSLILREIEAACRSQSEKARKIVSEVSFSFPSEERLVETIGAMEIPLESQGTVVEGSITFGRFNSALGFVKESAKLKDITTWPSLSPRSKEFPWRFVSMFTARFGGKERFQLIQSKPKEDLKKNPTTALSSLFQDDFKRGEVRKVIYDAFKKYFVIDPTGMTNLEIRLSDVAPSSELERSWGHQSVRFFKAAKPISEFSDGVQVFTGLVMTVLAGEEKIMLIDEPEAFLHPSLCNVLGNQLSTLMSKREGNLIVSTHSPYFIMGCLQAGKPINLVRLTHSDADYATARLLSSEKVKELFRNPLLRSSGVIQALFHRAVIIGEGDADRAFYNEINERLLAHIPSAGISDALFLNAQNKQTVSDIIKPLREMGVPAAGIVDVDIVKQGGREFTKHLDACRIPVPMHQALQFTRASIMDALEKSGKDMKKGGGLNLLEAPDKEQAEKFIMDLAEYGLFVVPYGELESWLKSLNCPTGHKPTWLREVFEKMGTDPRSSNYVKPGTGDIWEFLRSIQKWVDDPLRKGM